MAVWKQTEGKTGRMKKQNKGREVREEHTMKGIQDKVNKVKIKEYREGKKGRKKTLSGGKNITN
jgi:hypothetical protein